MALHRFSLSGMSVGAWKTLLCFVALFVVSILATELWYAPRFLAEVRGTLGIQFHELPAWGRSRFVIDRVEPDSPLRVAGAEVGDLWMPDRHYDAYRWFEAGESVGLTLVQSGTIRHVTVATVQDRSRPIKGVIIEHWAIVLVGLFLGLLIGFRQPIGLAFRACSLGMLFSALSRVIPTYVTLPAGTAFMYQHVLWGPILAVVALAIPAFLFNFPDDQSRNTRIKRWLVRYGVPVLVASALVFVVVSTVRALGYSTPLSMRVAFAAPAITFMSVSILVLWSNWHDSEKDLRERHFWIGLAFGLWAPAPVVANLLLLGTTGEAALQGVIFVPRTMLLLSLLLFAYAVLRHRVVSVSFVVNRATVYGAASLGMLLSFGLLEWFTHSLFAAWGHEQSPFVDAGIALAIILGFHRLRHTGEKWIERLFFHAWQVKEQALRKFVKEAPFVTQSRALFTGFKAALDQFTDNAGYAIYTRTADGDYARLAATLVDAPKHLDADEPLAVALRARRAPTHCSDANSSLPGDIALPSLHHDQLAGFVIVGSKPNGDTYRPDEVEVLGYATREVGLNLRALRMEQLERENNELRIREEVMIRVLQKGN
jgi:hypothetical protein